MYRSTPRACAMTSAAIVLPVPGSPAKSVLIPRPFDRVANAHSSSTRSRWTAPVGELAQGEDRLLGKHEVAPPNARRTAPGQALERRRVLRPGAGVNIVDREWTRLQASAERGRSHRLPHLVRPEAEQGHHLRKIDAGGHVAIERCAPQAHPLASGRRATSTTSGTSARPRRIPRNDSRQRGRPAGFGKASHRSGLKVEQPLHGARNERRPAEARLA